MNISYLSWYSTTVSLYSTYFDLLTLHSCLCSVYFGLLFCYVTRTGDGEIDPGNTVEVLFRNDEDGQENYDAMDAMVRSVTSP